MSSLRLHPCFLLTNCRTGVVVRGHRQIFYSENRSVIHNIYNLQPSQYHKEVISPYSEASY